jgi:hypothetical protein
LRPHDAQDAQDAEADGAGSNSDSDDDNPVDEFDAIALLVRSGRRPTELMGPPVMRAAALVRLLRPRQYVCAECGNEPVEVKL